MRYGPIFSGSDPVGECSGSFFIARDRRLPALQLVRDLRDPPVPDDDVGAPEGCPGPVGEPGSGDEELPGGVLRASVWDCGARETVMRDVSELKRMEREIMTNELARVERELDEAASRVEEYERAHPDLRMPAGDLRRYNEAGQRLLVLQTERLRLAENLAWLR